MGDHPWSAKFPTIEDRSTDRWKTDAQTRHLKDGGWGVEKAFYASLCLPGRFRWFKRRNRRTKLEN